MTPVEVGRIEAIFRYPVKSMRGEPLEAVTLGWHGLEGDRRLALRRLVDQGGFPWLTASTLSELVLFTPRGQNGDALPTHIHTPEGEEMPVFGNALAAYIERRHGSPVQMMRLNNGIFDDASISVITTDTAREICRAAGQNTDVRRFRPNLVVRPSPAPPFAEDGWVGGVLTFGEGDEAPAVTVTTRDLRCVMINIDPDDGSRASEVLKAAARLNQSHAGIYAAVTRSGRVAVGQTVLLHR